MKEERRWGNAELADSVDVQIGICLLLPIYMPISLIVYYARLHMPLQNIGLLSESIDTQHYFLFK